MRRLVFVAFMLLACCLASTLFTGCKKERLQPQSAPIDSTRTDSISIDSLFEEEEEEPMPIAADELFDDFIFNFASNSRLQASRITFPLIVKKSERTDTLSRKDWEMEHFFMEQDYYTLILDNLAQFESVKDTSVNHAIVEKIYLESGYVTQYIFNREGGTWRMTAINDTTYKGTPNESFLTFYTRFTTDSIFQEASIANPLRFSGPDPDDDFSTMEGVIMPEQWQMFAPDLPRDMLYNVVYGEPARSSVEKLFVVRGIANGLETELTFHRREGRWKLTKLAM